ncbi:MAG: hypothetical protein ABUL72_04030 [Armatimonadota bacterium]
MRLKYWTTALLGFGLTLILASPLALSGKPEDPLSREMKMWVLRFGIYTCVTAFVWVLVALMAVLLIRSIRRDMVAERELNMKILLEKTLADHAKELNRQSDAQSG